MKLLGCIHPANDNPRCNWCNINDVCNTFLAQHKWCMQRVHAPDRRCLVPPQMLLHNKAKNTMHRTGGVCAQRGHSAHMTGRNWGFCYNWQYSCLYKPYYTPTMLDSLMFHPPSIRDASVPSHSKDTCKKRQE